MKRVVAISLLLTTAAVAQTLSPAQQPRLLVYHKLPGDPTSSTTWRWVPVYIDEPLEIAIVDGVAHLRIKQEFKCRPELDYYVGTQQASYPLKSPVNKSAPPLVYVNGLLLSPDKYTVAADFSSLTLAGQFPSPEIVIRYCTMQ